ncbi:MAG: dTMP kinase [Treponemataceae bacterium]
MVLQNFIVFEGIDGSGTSTQMNILKERLKLNTVHFTAEPTSSETGTFLRQILAAKVSVHPQTIAYLFAADRCEHMYGKGGIIEQLEQNRAVICDRYIFSSLAYQSQECGEELPALLNQRFPLPQILFFFDIQPEVSLQRIKNRGVTEIYEKEDFLKKTSQSYSTVINFYEQNVVSGMKIVRIDATQSIESITEKILAELKNLPIQIM